MNLVWGPNANDLLTDIHTTYFPFGNAISLTSIDGSDITAVDTTIKRGADLLVVQNTYVDDPDMTLTLEKEAGHTKALTVDVWVDDNMSLGVLTPSNAALVVTSSIISEADPTAHFNGGVSYTITNRGHDLSGNSVSLGSIGLETHFLNRNAYRVQLKSITYASIPLILYNALAFNKNSTLRSTYSIYTTLYTTSSTVSVYMKKDMFASHRYALCLRIRRIDYVPRNFHRSGTSVFGELFRL